jgi:hypothetical protein
VNALKGLTTILNQGWNMIKPKEAVYQTLKHSISSRGIKFEDGGVDVSALLKEHEEITDEVVNSIYFLLKSNKLETSLDLDDECTHTYAQTLLQYWLRKDPRLKNKPTSLLMALMSMF